MIRAILGVNPLSIGPRPMKYLSALLILMAAAIATAQQSNSLESDWLPLVTGERCDKSGAEIMSVSQHPETNHHRVLVRIPKAQLGEDPTMEEVRVVAKAPEKLQLANPFPELETEWVDDYDNDHYGLLVKLTSDQAVPIRLFFSTGDTQWDGAVQQP